jgi:glutamate-ammonia-ligase adenylyltransferase
MALNNWERFVRELDSPLDHYNTLLSQPMRLEILLSIFSGSQFLSDALILNPAFFEWITLPKNVQSLIVRKDAENELRNILLKAHDNDEWLKGLRIYKKRHILRIGTRDICLQAPLQDIVQELSILAEATIQVALDKAISRVVEKNSINKYSDKLKDAFCVMALGKLGGKELNYSSDIDLIGIFDNSIIAVIDDCSGFSTEKFYSSVMSSVRSDLSSYTEEGHAYRVDLRLRPYGKSGQLVYSLDSLEKYYKTNASLWEIQALLKIRPVAGNLNLGNIFIDKISSLLFQEFKPAEVVSSIENMRDQAVKLVSKKGGACEDVKSGLGGIRDIEFLVQGLQLIHMRKNHELLNGNTLMALNDLHKTGILTENVFTQITEDYIFLRKVEHVLQIYEDRQTHSIPQNEAAIKALAKRILGKDANHDIFFEKLKSCQSRVRKAYDQFLTAV